ncbi:MAG TPA: PAS domain-containing protein [Mycoplana sp.]|nr:PAS domain-containing protein [Mycoplana sp.]
MQTTTTRAIHAYWSRVRRGRDIPDRRDIEPADLRQHLPDLFILEQVAGSGPVFRLAGTRLCALFGRELRGKVFEGLFAPDARDRVGRICGTVMSQRRPAVLQASAYGRSVQPIAVEVLLLPMTSHSSHADRIFGALAPLTPVRPLDMPFRSMALETHVTVDREQECELLREPPASPPPATIVRVGAQDIGQRVRRMLHLRVFDGGK